MEKNIEINLIKTQITNILEKELENNSNCEDEQIIEKTIEKLLEENEDYNEEFDIAELVVMAEEILENDFEEETPANPTDKHTEMLKEIYTEFSDKMSQQDELNNTLTSISSDSSEPQTTANSSESSSASSITSSTSSISLDGNFLFFDEDGYIVNAYGKRVGRAKLYERTKFKFSDVSSILNKKKMEEEQSVNSDESNNNSDEETSLVEDNFEIIPKFKNQSEPVVLSFKNHGKPKTFVRVSTVVPYKAHNDNDLLFKKAEIEILSLEKRREKVVKLREIILPEQRSPEWFKMRENRLTASDLAAALGECAYKSRDKTIVEKCGERTFFGNAITEWGVKYEPVATAIYEKRTKSEVIEFGLMPHNTIPFLGASPDGITTDGIMLEIKCPPNRQITGIVPHGYWVQMQLQLEVCELEECDFEECKLEEYDSQIDFLQDNYCDEDGKVLDETRNADNMEKGAVIVYFDVENNKPGYEYHEIGIPIKDILAWVEKTKKEVFDDPNKKFTEVTYWYLTIYSVVRVERNRSWFERRLPDMENFWRDVCFYRNVGVDILKAKMAKNKRQTYIDPTINEDTEKNCISIEGYHFQSDDDSDSEMEEETEVISL